jgi:transposase-like protein
MVFWYTLGMEIKPLPTSLIEAVRYFSDLDVCRGYLSHLRWPDGVMCPREACHGTHVQWIGTRKIWRCKKCGRQFTVKLGTIFEDSPIGLDKWLVAVWAITSMKNGISSHELARTLGITQKSAWFMNHRIRAGMHCPSFSVRLAGEVEADEAFVGGLGENMHANKRKAIAGRGGKGKAMVMGVLQRRGDVRAFVLPEGRHGVSIRRVVRENVDEGSNLYTDALNFYRPLDVDFQHSFVDHAKAYVEGRVHTNGLENFWSLLKRGLKGTYVSVLPEHLHRYVDEQVYRFNSRKMKDGERFAKSLGNVSGKRLTYKALIGKA